MYKIFSGGGQSSKMGCRDCLTLHGGQCVPSGHRTCTLDQLRTLRAEHLAPQVNLLQRATEISKQLQHVQGEASKEVQGRLTTLRQQLQQLDQAAALVRQAAEDERADLRSAEGAAAAHAGRMALLEGSARLLAAEGNCSLTLDGGPGKPAWRGSVQLPTDKRTTLLRHALVELLADGSLGIETAMPLPSTPTTPVSPVMPVTPVTPPTTPVTPVTPTTPVTPKAAPCLATETEKPPTSAKELDLSAAGIAEVRAIRGLDCTRLAELAEPLLRAVAPHLEELEATHAKRAHMEIIKDMGRLQKLKIHCSRGWEASPDLPLQLEELEVTNARRPHLQSVQRMSRLRALVVNGYAYDEVLFPALPPGYCGLERLRLVTDRWDTAMTLVRAHAATLRELELACAAGGTSPFGFPALAETLGHCGLPALRRLTLRRARSGGELDHDVPSCREQVRAIREGLQRTGKSHPELVVSCEECDNAPPAEQYMQAL